MIGIQLGQTEPDGLGAGQKDLHGGHDALEPNARETGDVTQRELTRIDRVDVQMDMDMIDAIPEPFQRRPGRKPRVDGDGGVGEDAEVPVEQVGQVWWGPVGGRGVIQAEEHHIVGVDDTRTDGRATEGSHDVVMRRRHGSKEV